MSKKVSMQFCSRCQLYRLCQLETRRTILGVEQKYFCIEHRKDYGQWQYALTLRYGKFVIVASGLRQTTVKAQAETLEQARVITRSLKDRGFTVIEMLPDSYQ